ncbi:MAG TPA: hypothetical protein VNK03_05840 [Gammaproteobacteria bacterium]|nr:hypothetical protein [Gammaproteobacteria bacterium]
MVDVEQIYSVAKEIYEAVEQAKKNQEKFNDLANRVRSLEPVARSLAIYKVRTERTDGALQNFLDTLTKCLTFIRDFSTRSQVTKLMKAGADKEEFNNLDQALTKCRDDLKFVMDMEKDVHKVSNERDSILIKSPDEKAGAEDQVAGTAYVLERLEKMFLKKRQWGSRTDNLKTYNQCLQKVRPGLELCYNYKEKVHVLTLKDTEWTDTQSKDELHKMVTLAQSKIFLRLVAEGEQDKAEAMLKSNSDLALVPGDVTDLSKCTFTNITGFQYAVWALDWHMWTMIRKYLPPAEAQRQAQGFETGAWVRSHGVHANLNILIRAYKTTIDLYNASKNGEAGSAWVRQVGGAQLLLPAHVVNEYCHPTRPFFPLPNFKDAAPLPRTRTLREGEWFTAEYFGGRLGENFAVLRQGRASGVGCRPWGQADAIASPVMHVDGLSHGFEVVRALNITRAAQRVELIAELMPKNIQRRAA